MPLSLNSALDDLRLSGIRRFPALAAQTPGCVSLTLGEPGEGTPAAVCVQVGIDLDHGLTHYPPNNGFAWLREAICAWEAERGVVLPPGNVIVTDGATEALYPELADRTIVANSFSKPWAMTGCGLAGWVLARRPQPPWPKCTSTSSCRCLLFCSMLPSRRWQPTRCR